MIVCADNPKSIEAVDGAHADRGIWKRKDGKHIAGIGEGGLKAIGDAVEASLSSLTEGLAASQTRISAFPVGIFGTETWLLPPFGVWTVRVCD